MLNVTCLKYPRQHGPPKGDSKDILRAFLPSKDPGYPRDVPWEFRTVWDGLILCSIAKYIFYILNKGDLLSFIQRIIQHLKPFGKQYCS